MNDFASLYEIWAEKQTEFFTVLTLKAKFGLKPQLPRLDSFLNKIDFLVESTYAEKFTTK